MFKVMGKSHLWKSCGIYQTHNVQTHYLKQTAEEILRLHTWFVNSGLLDLSLQMMATKCMLPFLLPL